MNKKFWFLLSLLPLSFVAKALIYQFRGRILDELVCMGWFVVLNSALGGLYFAKENVERQREQRRIRAEIDRWKAAMAEDDEGGIVETFYNKDGHE